jgi:hypothetical protein
MTIEQLASTFHPLNGCYKKILAIMKAYLDESGIHAGAKMCAIAGYFGHENSWKKFEKLWPPVLKEFGVPEYHAKRFFARDKNGNRIGEYTGWNDRKATHFYGRLLKVVTECRVFPVASVIVSNEWKALNQNERRYLTGGQVKNGKFITSGAPSKSYFLPFLMVVTIVGDYCLEGELANLFFGLDKSFSGYALDYFKKIQKLKGDYCRHLGSIDFPPAANTYPLQAADLLAYETYQYSLKRLEYDRYPLRAGTALARAMSRIKNPDMDFKLFDKIGIDLALEDFRSKNPNLCTASTCTVGL